MLGTDLLISDADGVRRVALHRPDSRNGLTVPLVETLAQVVADAAADPSVRVFVLTGEGGAFCSGLDLRSAMDNLESPERSIVHFHALIRNLRGMLKPTLAAIDGAAAGFGADMALACDLRWGSARASLGERFVRIGLMPDGGATWFLPRLVGQGRAMELLYEGRMVDAAEAERLGLLNRALPTEGFHAAVQAYAARLAQGPPLAYARMKAAVLAANPGLEQALAAEREGQLQLLQTGDFLEGVQAFLGKRAPAFTGT